MENEKKLEFVSLVSDTVFKYMWKNEATRSWFNEIILDKTGIDLSNFELVDNEDNTGSSVKDQRNDIVLSDFDRDIVIVEMNSSYSESQDKEKSMELMREILRLLKVY